MLVATPFAPDAQPMGPTVEPPEQVWSSELVMEIEPVAVEIHAHD
jgi:hypothetical protein